MVAVRGAELTLGYSAGKRVVDGFCLDRTEVTAADYATCVAARKCRPAPLAIVPAREHRHCTYRQQGGETKPANCLEREDAEAFCSWRGKTLPTLAELVLAARGYEARRFPWGDAPDPSASCVGREDEGPCSVGSFPRGASPEGALDLIGNVSEIARDGVDVFGAFGGDYRTGAVDEIRAERWSHVSAAPSPRTGFRCAAR